MHTSPSRILCSLCRGRFGLLVGVLRTGYKNKTQARRSRVRTNFTYLLAKLQVPSSDKVLLLIYHFRHSESEWVREWVQFSAHLSFSSKAARSHVFFFPMNGLLSFITENLIVTLVLCISADDLDLMLSSL